MVLDALLDLVLPQSCAGCRREATRWCPVCAEQLRTAVRRPLGRTAPDPVPPGFPPAAAAATYDGAVRGALLAHKERGRLALVRPLGAALAAAVTALDPPPGVVLVPVPSDPRVVRSRGHDHARRLARRAAGVLRASGLDARAAHLLVHGRRVVDQAGLDTAGRSANLHGALRARGPLPRGLVVVVVDDVVTSGATLAEAARALAAAGARVHGAATVAATVRRARSTNR